MTLGNAGLVRDLGQAIFELHPLLTSYLRAARDALPPGSREGWTRAFVDVMGRKADAVAPRLLHEQQFTFLIHEANFHAARGAARPLSMHEHDAALTQALAVYAQNTHNYPAAAALYDQLQAIHARTGNETGRAAAYHQLGRVAEERRDFAAADGWYRKSLEVEERLGDEHGAAITYHQLGRVAKERRDFDSAWKSYLTAVTTYARFDDQHNLGIVAGSLARSYRDAPADVRPQLLALGREAGLPDEWLQAIEQTANAPPGSDTPLG